MRAPHVMVHGLVGGLAGVPVILRVLIHAVLFVITLICTVPAHQAILVIVVSTLEMPVMALVVVLV